MKKLLFLLSSFLFFLVLSQSSIAQTYTIVAVDECGNPVENAHFVTDIIGSQFGFFLDITLANGQAQGGFQPGNYPQPGDILRVTFNPSGEGTGATPSQQTYTVPNTDGNWSHTFTFTILGANSPDEFRMAYTCDGQFQGTGGRIELSEFDGNLNNIEEFIFCNGESLAACGDDLLRRCDPSLNSCAEVSYSATLYKFSLFGGGQILTINPNPCSNPTLSGNTTCSYCALPGNQGGHLPEEVAPELPTNPGIYWWEVQAYCCSNGGTPLGDPEIYPFEILDNSTAPGDFVFNVSFALETRFPDGDAGDAQRDRSTDLSNPAVIGAAQSGLDLSSMNGKGVTGYTITVEEFPCNDETGAQEIASLSSGSWQLPPHDPNNLPTDIEFSDFVWEPGTSDPYFVINYSTVVSLCYKVTIEYDYACGSSSAESYFKIAPGCIWCLQEEGEESAERSSDLNESDQFSFYPNPADNRIMISGVQEGSKIVLINIKGQTVLERPVRGSRAQLDLSQLNSGIYLIRLQKPDGSNLHQKLVIK